MTSKDLPSECVTTQEDRSCALQPAIRPWDFCRCRAVGTPRSLAIWSSNTFSRTPFVGHSIHEWVTLFSNPVKCAVIRTVVEEPCDLARIDRTARPASHVPRMFVGRCAYSLRTISDISPAPTFRGPVVINPLLLSIVSITANDEISETKTPHTLSKPA